MSRKPRPTDELVPGAAVYSPLTLPFYDAVVHGASNPLLWRCPTHRLIAPYERLAHGDHLDVGVGTGFFLDRARLAAPLRSLTLLDVNPACLAAAGRRLSRFRPVAVTADLFAPLPAIGPFSSVSLTYVLHCLAGSMAEKAVVFDHLAGVMADDGVLFGATLFQKDVSLSPPARALQGLYNARGIFSNRLDRPRELRHHLEKRFSRVRFEMVGLVGLFEAQGPVRAAR